MGSDDGHIKYRFSRGLVNRTPRSNPAQEYAWIVRRTDQLLAEEIDAGIPVGAGAGGADLCGAGASRQAPPSAANGRGREYLRAPHAGAPPCAG